MVAGKRKMRRSVAVSPDSTTAGDRGPPWSIAPGCHVIAQGSDGRRYLGTVLKVDVHGDGCLVGYDDGTSLWSRECHVQPLAARGQLNCLVCGSRSEIPQSPLDCSGGQGGYMVRCLECERPAHWSCLASSLLTTPRGWRCSSCAKLGDRGGRMCVEGAGSSCRLPYDLGELSWDEEHRSNVQGVYCYCGGPGQYSDSMWQCRLCLQWFHDLCTDPPDALLPGDRLFVFRCRVCTGTGREMWQREEVGWRELLHLALFNLHLTHSGASHPGFSIDTDILPWLQAHWLQLRVPAALARQLPEHWHLHALSVLSEEGTFERVFEGEQEAWRLRQPLLPPSSLPDQPANDEAEESATEDGESGESRSECAPPATDSNKRSLRARSSTGLAATTLSLPPPAPLVRQSECSSDEAVAQGVGGLASLVPLSHVNPFSRRMSDSPRPPAPPPPRAPAVITRQLCARDICVDKHGQVRRRRRRKPVRAVGGRQLVREVCDADGQRSRVMTSDRKMWTATALCPQTELDSVTFRLLARRTSAHGEVQYLVIWES